MKERVLITGGAGFIGSHLCGLLLKEGFAVICLDNLITGNKDNIKHLSEDKNFEFIKYDASKDIRVAGRIKYVLHFASPASPVDYLKYPVETLRAGAMGTHNTLELARSKKAVFMLASTSEVYGDPLEHPQKESYWGNVNCVGPRSVYDEAKRFAEALTMAYKNTYGVDTRIVRIFNTYGERMRENDGRAIPNFIYEALSKKPLTVFGDGSQTRSFCYISDLIDGIYKLMKSGLHAPVNIGNPNEMTVLELARLIIKITGTKSGIVYRKLPVDDPKVRRPDIALAKSRLRWEPKVPLEKGLKKTIKYFKDKKGLI